MKALSLLQSIRTHKMGRIGLYLLVGLLLFVVVGGVFSPYSPHEQGDLVKERYQSPSWNHWFGTDKYGRDLFTRVAYGGRISLLIGFCVVLISFSFGVAYGSISGYVGGIWDAILMRFLDFWLAFPTIFLIMFLVALYRPSFWAIILILSLTSWMDTARIMRTEVLIVKNQDYVLAAKGLGLSPLQVLFHHVIGNAIAPAAAVLPLRIGEMILLESALSFLGLGVQPPMASWGSLINDGKDVLLQAWWIATIPGLFIVLTVMSFNFIGEAIKENQGLRKGNNMEAFNR